MTPAEPVPDVVQVTVAGDDREALGLLGVRAVESRLAACAQLGGAVESVYRWDGRTERAEEWLLTLKTAADRAPELVALVADRHPYAVPEVLVTPVAGGHGPYLDWVREQTRPGA